MPFVTIGKIVKTRGLKGEVKVLSETSFPEKFKTRKRLFLGKTETDAVLFEVDSARIQDDFVFLAFKGIDSLEKAEPLLGSTIFLDEREMAKPRRNEAFIHELIGLTVVNEALEPLGVVSNVFNYPSCDSYEIQLEADRSKTILIPALEEFIASVDLQNRKVIVRRFEEFL
ncbi:MAG: ribosome maturation factor RimM [Chloroherpetonaceae bacterium]|nr:ribosome maturation factor RimM [Chloroherpetonaceae bacterium]